MSQRNKKSQAGQLRIVAGNWRSRLLQIADVDGLRPTSERIRETLFNWLAPKIVGASCLDLCAGTGALGLEALSRGAGRAVFIESSGVAEKMLRENIESLGTMAAEVLKVDALGYLGAAAPHTFDIVFLDPPFAADMLGELCRLLAMPGWLATDAMVYLEMDRSQPMPQLPKGWRVLKNKTAGNVRYTLVTPAAREEQEEQAE